MRTLLALLALCPCALVPAQNFTVSPLSATRAEGNSISMNQPFSSPYFQPRPTYRYQQVHNDVRGNPWLLRGLSFRRDAAGYGMEAFARTLDAEIFVGEGDYDTATINFSSNFLGQRFKVMNRKNINLPDFTSPQGGPAPWSIVIAFDAPWPYLGQQGLLWEILIHWMTNIGPYPCDAHSGLIGSSNTVAGVACTATGQNHGIMFTPVFGSAISLLRLSAVAFFCPPNAATLLLLGHSDANLPVPGLCPALRVAPLVVFPGITSARSDYLMPDTDFAPDPTLVGATIFSQFFVHDPGQSGLPFAGSHGFRSYIPPPPPFKIRRIWANDVNATTGNPIEQYPYGLVVRFSHP